MRKVLVISTLLFILMLIVPANSSPTLNVYDDRSLEEGVPILSVLKWSSAEDVEVGSSVTVYVNITNWSDKPAYDLDIEEPIFNDWSRTNFTGYDVYEYIRIDPFASVSYQYSMELINEGNYTIEPTSITYTDVNGTQITARSSFIPLNVYIEPPALDRGEYFSNIFGYALVLLGIPILALIIIRYRS